jgi:biopolymer transport protein ExbB
VVVVVVESVSLLELEAGGVTTVVLLSTFFSSAAGGFTIVVFFSTFSSPPAAGGASMRCSQAVNSAAIARGRMSIFVFMGFLIIRNSPAERALRPALLVNDSSLAYKAPMLDYMQKGGPLMWLILLCSIVSIGVFLERLIYYHRATIRVGEFLRGLSNLIQRRAFAEALHECAATPGPVARVIHAAIIRHDAHRDELKDIVQEAGQLEVPKLERNLMLLSTIVFITPLIGLLGTVLGLIQAFVTISSQSGFASTTDISNGIYQSLLTTAAGLVVAIPCSVGYSYLSSRVNALLHDIERGGIEVVNMISDSRRASSGAEIIEFEKADARRHK